MEDGKHKAGDVATLVTKSGIGSIGQLLAIILRYVYTLVITQTLGAGAYGLFVLGRTVTLFSGLIASIGMGPAVRKQIPHYRVLEQFQRIRTSIRFGVQTALLGSLAMAGLVFLLAPVLAEEVFKEKELTSVIRWLCLTIPFAALIEVLLNLFKGFKQVSLFVWIKNITLPGLNIALLLVAGWTGGSLLSIVLAFVGAHVGSLLVSLWLKKTRIPALPEQDGPEPETPLPTVRTEMFEFGLPLMFTSALDFILRWTDILMLGWLAGAVATGIFNVSLRMASFVALPLVAVNLIFSPMIAEIHARNDRDRLRTNYQFVTKLVFTASLTIFALILLFPGELLSLFGKEFSQGEMALVVICFGQLINTSMGATGQLLVMTGHVNTHFINSVIFLLVTVVLNYLLIPKFGILGAGIANAITLSGLNITRIIQVHHYLRIQPFRLDYLKPVLAFAVAAGVVFYLRDWLAWKSGWTAVLFALIFCAIHLAILTLAGFSQEEKMIFSMVKKKFTKMASPSQ